MIGERRTLPSRRAETFEIEWGGFGRRFAVTLWFYDDGALGEVFITGGKSGEADRGNRTRCGGRSLAGTAVRRRDRQHGDRNHRDSTAAPSSILGAVVDELRGSQTRLDESQPVTSERRADGATTGHGR